MVKTFMLALFRALRTDRFPCVRTQRRTVANLIPCEVVDIDTGDSKLVYFSADDLEPFMSATNALMTRSATPPQPDTSEPGAGAPKQEQ